MSWGNVQFLREKGMALPIALFMLLLISAVTSILFQSSQQNFNQVEISQVANETYYVAEGVLNYTIADMSARNLLWKDKVPLATVPSNYASYSPATYVSSNGIPTCNYLHCHRDLYPTGGGLIKNLGPIGGDGETVNSSFAISEQFDPASPVDSDIDLVSSSGWSQVERLEQTTPSASTIGGNLSNSLAEGGNANRVRFRVTGISSDLHKGSRSYATVVAVVEMPPT